MTGEKRAERLTVPALVVAVVVMISFGLFGLGHSIWYELTEPTVDETISLIPIELMPEGWEPVRAAFFGGPMLNNGGRDYILVYDDEGFAWEFSRTHRRDDWERNPIWRHECGTDCEEE